MANRGRKPLGAGIAVITMVIGAILIASLGFFSFELIRHNTAHDELRSACEASALAGAAAMASSDSLDPNVTHNNAINAAQSAFSRNTILGKSLLDVDTQGMTGGTRTTFVAPPDKSAMFVEFLDPNSNPPNQAVPMGDPRGRIVHVEATYTNQPPFGRFLGIPALPIRSAANGRVPSLDVVMCFDVSGSIDDQTPVTVVRRLWDPAKRKSTGLGTGAINYQTAQGQGGPTPGGLAQGRIYDIFGPGPTGIGLEAAAPQNLTSATQGSRKYYFSTAMRAKNGSESDPPGNHPGGGDPYRADEFSDIVVNIDGNQVYGGNVTINSAGRSYSFPDVATLVEASRGNLEGNGVFTSSGAQGSVPASVTPKPGYQAVYRAAALANTKPIADARNAAMTFFQIMHNNTDAHFGLVTFSDQGYTNPSGTFPPANSVARTYPAGGTTTVNAVGVQLDKNDDKLTDVLMAIPKTQAHGGTAMADALDKAYQMLKDGSTQTRKSAKKAILMFTDGQPTVPSTGSRSWETTADKCKDDGIAVYTIGLAQNSAIVQGECEHLNAGAGLTVNYIDPQTNQPDSYTPQNDGMSAHAKNGGKFFLVTKASDLRYVFENIARQLVQLVKGTS